MARVRARAACCGAAGLVASQSAARAGETIPREGRGFHLWERKSSRMPWLGCQGMRALGGAFLSAQPGCKGAELGPHASGTLKAGGEIWSGGSRTQAPAALLPQAGLISMGTGLWESHPKAEQNPTGNSPGSHTALPARPMQPPPLAGKQCVQ